MDVDFNKPHIAEPTYAGSPWCVCGVNRFNRTTHLDPGFSIKEASRFEFDPRVLDEPIKKPSGIVNHMMRKAEAYRYQYRGGSVRTEVTTYFVNIFNDHNDPIPCKTEAIADTLFLMFVERGIVPTITKETRWLDASKDHQWGSDWR